MKWLDNLLKVSKENYKQKIIRKKLNNKTKISYKNVTHNDEEINFKFIRINSKQEIDKYLRCSKFENFKTCFLITWTNSFDTIDFIEQIDLVVCDIEWRVKRLYESLPVDTEIEFNKNCHLFIMPHNSISHNSIKLDDYLKPF